MKKLILLAVIVFGFAASTLAQTYHLSAASGGAQGAFSVVTTVSPQLNIEVVSPMNFGAIVNTVSGGTVRLWPDGSLVPSTGIGVVPSRIGTPATFLIKGSTLYPTITIGNPNQTVSGYYTFNIIQNQDCSIAPHGAYAGQYDVKIGGTLTLNPGVTGDLSAINVNVTVNAQ